MARQDLREARRLGGTSCGQWLSRVRFHLGIRSVGKAKLDLSSAQWYFGTGLVPNSALHPVMLLQVHRHSASAIETTDAVSSKVAPRRSASGINGATQLFLHSLKSGVNAFVRIRDILIDKDTRAVLSSESRPSCEIRGRNGLQGRSADITLPLRCGYRSN